MWSQMEPSPSAPQQPRDPGIVGEEASVKWIWAWSKSTVWTSVFPEPFTLRTFTSCSQSFICQPNSTWNDKGCEYIQHAHMGWLAIPNARHCRCLIHLLGLLGETLKTIWPLPSHFHPCKPRPFYCILWVNGNIMIEITKKPFNLFKKILCKQVLLFPFIC